MTIKKEKEVKIVSNIKKVLKDNSLVDNVTEKHIKSNIKIAKTKHDIVNNIKKADGEKQIGQHNVDLDTKLNSKIVDIEKSDKKLVSKKNFVSDNVKLQNIAQHKSAVNNYHFGKKGEIFSAKKKVNENIFYATGKRKRSIAKVWYNVKKENKFNDLSVNDLPIGDYFTRVKYKEIVLFPFHLMNKVSDLKHFKISVFGGGLSGQADAIKLAISKIYLTVNEENRKLLRENDLLTRDSRKVERKKPGLKKARRKEQFSKR